MIQNLFPVPVYVNKIKSSVDLKTICLDMANGESVKRSNKGGYQSPDVASNKNFSKLIYAIEFAANKFAVNLGLKNNLKVDNLWVNVNGYKDYNLIHSHPKCVFSGAYYVSVPNNSGRLEFYSPAYEGIEYDWNNNVQNRNITNSAILNYDLDENLLLIFPSWLKHQVEPNLNEKEKRISIAFNLAAVA